MAGIKRSPNRTGTVSMQTNPPCLRMKALRNRAGYRAADISGFLVHAGVFKKAAPNNWYRYENPQIMKDDPLPCHIIEPLIPHFVNRGMPPITATELIAISEAHSIQNRSTVLARELTAHAFARDDSTIPMIHVKYRAERGTYMLEAKLESGSYGVSQIAAVPEFSTTDQFVTLVADAHAYPVYDQGTPLHCVSPSVLPQKSLIGKRVVVKVSRNDLWGVLVGQVEKIVGETVVVQSVDGKPINGEIIGIVLARHIREW